MEYISYAPSDAFDEDEIKGRYVMSCVIDGNVIAYEFTKDKYEKVDLLVTGFSKTAAVEIKYRKPKYTSTYIDNLEGHMLEWNKFTALTIDYKTYEVPIYAMIYTDSILMWNVSDITEDMFVYEEDKYPNTTEGKNKRKVPKKVCYLKRKDAIYDKPNIYNEYDS